MLPRFFRRPSEQKGLLCTTDTTGTFNVHRYREASRAFSDTFGLQRARTLMMPGCQHYVYIFGCLLWAVYSGVAKCWKLQLFQPFRRLKYEDLGALLIPPGPWMSTGAEICWICFRMCSADQRARASIRLGWSWGGQQDKIVFSDAWLFSCLLTYRPVLNFSAYFLVFSKTYGLGWACKYRWYCRNFVCPLLLRLAEYVFEYIWQNKVCGHWWCRDIHWAKGYFRMLDCS